ncbi:CRTAC1 family protein [Actinocrispum wychmicini]|uniref:CRTAC1 family protein n=1 Tax=Actinocrispum wychmicini TaxID=1213861 RepID=UPI001FB5B523|nr:CRTAC1 family protein [Actinocrispum wychmicini]
MAAILLASALAWVSQASVASADADQVAAKYRFHELPISFPPGYADQPMRTVRQVNPAYYKIRSWISAVGASIAINDLAGHGRSDAMCIVDTRTDEVVVTYTPTAPAEDQFTPFVLNPAPLPMDDAMAPMGCVPGDYNGDGRMDLLVYYWGRTPVVFLAKSDRMDVSLSSYYPQELVPSNTVDGKYHGPRWNTNAVNVDDYNGDGQPDIYVGNYFPDSDIINPNGLNNVQMPASLSNARNGGGAHVLRWHSASTGDKPAVSYVEDVDAVPFDAATGWTLGIASADLTGTGKPELYVANDFGHHHLLHNVSTRDQIRFTEAFGERNPGTAKSFVLGNASFKGMGVDFGDLTGSGRFDMVVSNITTAWGLEESNMVWINQAKSQADMKAKLDQGIAPFTQEAQELGMAWTGWCWDVKMADFRNSGNLDVVQTDGFVQGDNNRWAWLQELAMNNDTQLANPLMWPNVQPGDDLSGHEVLGFYGKAADGTWVNVSRQIGLGVAIPTRGVAMGDTTGTGRLDLAVARQWGPPAFYRNDAPDRGGFLNLQLYRPSTDKDPHMGLESTGTPAYGATVTVTTSDGRTQVSRLDGASGHGGKRSFDVHFGLGTANGPVTAHIQWRDVDGTYHEQTQQFTPGSHTLVLAGSVQEVASR